MLILTTLISVLLPYPIPIGWYSFLRDWPPFASGIGIYQLLFTNSGKSLPSILLGLAIIGIIKHSGLLIGEYV